MLIRLQEYLDYMEKHEWPMSGTIAVIKGKLDFSRTDGFIQFLKIALDQIPVFYGKQDDKWQKILDKIYRKAEKLQDSCVRFTGHTKEDFRKYCKMLSGIMDTDVASHLDVVSLDIAKGDDLAPIMKEHIYNKYVTGFYYEDSGDVSKQFMRDLMDQLSKLTFNKNHGNLDISMYLTCSNYHEHVHDALNIIMQTAVYAINCNSTKQKTAYEFDAYKIWSRLDYAESIMKRTEHVV